VCCSIGRRFENSEGGKRGGGVMNKEETLSDLINMRFEKTRATLEIKAGMYATTDNRLHNFDVAAHIFNCTSEQALQGMWGKHLVSVLDMIKWTETQPQRITIDLIDEKIGDTINYLILLESLLLRRIEKAEESEVEEE